MRKKKKKNFNSYLILFTKINFPGIIDLNVKPEIIKLPEEKTGKKFFIFLLEKNLCNHGPNNDFLDTTSKE